MGLRPWRRGAKPGWRVPRLTGSAGPIHGQLHHRGGGGLGDLGWFGHLARLQTTDLGGLDLGGLDGLIWVIMIWVVWSG